MKKNRTTAPMNESTIAIYAMALLGCSGKSEEAQLCTEFYLTLRGRPIPTEDHFLKLSKELVKQAPELFDLLISKDASNLKLKPRGEGYAYYSRPLLKSLSPAPVLNIRKELCPHNMSQRKII